MSNWVWKRRKRSVVLPKNNVKNCCKCMNCSASGYSDKLPKKTVFDSIMTSPEALAEKLVILVAHFYMRGRVKWLWRSTIIANGSWETREEAYNATVERLKEVAE